MLGRIPRWRSLTSVGNIGDRVEGLPVPRGSVVDRQPCDHRHEEHDPLSMTTRRGREAAGNPVPDRDDQDEHPDADSCFQ